MVNFHWEKISKHETLFQIVYLSHWKTDLTLLYKTCLLSSHQMAQLFLAVAGFRHPSDDCDDVLHVLLQAPASFPHGRQRLKRVYHTHAKTFRWPLPAFDSAWFVSWELASLYPRHTSSSKSKGSALVYHCDQHSTWTYGKVDCTLCACPISVYYGLITFWRLFRTSCGDEPEILDGHLKLYEEKFMSVICLYWDYSFTKTA